MPISLVVAVLHQPKLILTRLWPYIALLVSFVAFVYINGGVVLGKSFSNS
jgi:alpha-1,2-glucosyltransferase